MSETAGSFRSSGFKEVKRRQKKPLYCVTWSKDIFTNTRQKSFYYFATCGGINLSIFEIEIGNKSKDYRLKQSYYDNDENEEFHSCAFGGRSSINKKADTTQKSYKGNYLLSEERTDTDSQPPLSLCWGESSNNKRN